MWGTFTCTVSVGGRIVEIKVEGKPVWGLGLVVFVKTTRLAFTFEAFETFGKNNHLDPFNLDGLSNVIYLPDLALN